ncbi:CobW family GTP-binding protein [Psychrobacter alimentarius]|uniref:CobW family GTP-binding protein n=1 Tax=Psychrobacter TaxID=497 RepID=UPI000BAAF295|nr:GTP-binding protein [Psychrobacter sp. JB193]PAT64727.1 cobalamin biosynthesis protein P47K [Psychrobacter sp. JB193]
MMNAALKKSTVFQNIPCTLVTGFLGAGKTTVINQLLASKPVDERWALLINEFGRIGIDGSLLASSQDEAIDKNSIAIREVSGGCICCTSQLPLQIAISRLLSDHHPQRLIIEPTGLAHPRELIHQLSAPHWQTALQMQAVITVLSGVQWQQDKYRTHDGFQAHVKDADVLVINRYTHLSDSDKQALQAWVTKLNTQVHIIWASTVQAAPNNDNLSTTDITALNNQLATPSHIIAQQRTININYPEKLSAGLRPPNTALSPTSLSNSMQANDDNPVSPDIELPYRYHEKQQDILLAGWRLPAHYVLHADGLQEWLLKLPSWQRIKGVVHTSDGWLQINFTPDSLTTITVASQLDSRLEVILQAGDESDQMDLDDASPVTSAIDWEVRDRELMALVI